MTDLATVQRPGDPHARPGNQEDTVTHRVRSVYLNLIPVWECRLCGQRWRASADYKAIERQACRGWAW